MVYLGLARRGPGPERSKARRPSMQNPSVGSQDMNDGTEPKEGTRRVWTDPLGYRDVPTPRGGSVQYVIFVGRVEDDGSTADLQIAAIVDVDKEGTVVNVRDDEPYEPHHECVNISKYILSTFIAERGDVFIG